MHFSETDGPGSNVWSGNFSRNFGPDGNCDVDDEEDERWVNEEDEAETRITHDVKSIKREDHTLFRVLVFM